MKIIGFSLINPPLYYSVLIYSAKCYQDKSAQYSKLILKFASLVFTRNIEIYFYKKKPESKLLSEILGLPLSVFFTSKQLLCLCARGNKFTKMPCRHFSTDFPELR